MWDLRGKREMVALAYSGGAGTTGSSLHGGGAMAIGGRRGMSDVSWHPDNVGHLYIHLSPYLTISYRLLDLLQHPRTILHRLS